jgi:hypothetical protein
MTDEERGRDGKRETGRRETANYYYDFQSLYLLSISISSHLMSATQAATLPVSSVITLV